MHNTSIAKKNSEENLSDYVRNKDKSNFPDVDFDLNKSESSQAISRLLNRIVYSLGGLLIYAVLRN